MFKDAIDVVNRAKVVYLSAHVNPDGDAIGSTFAIYFALKQMGKKVHVVMPSYSTKFEFLPGVSSSVDKVEEDKYDLLIACDSSDKTRLALSEEDYNKALKVIMLDHHERSAPYGDFRYIMEKKSSASEIAYMFIKQLGVKIDERIATLLYAGIMTDTGSFNYSSTDADTMRAAADLMECGAKFVDVCKRLNDTMAESKLKLIAKTVDNMEVYNDGMFRYSYVDYNTMKELGINDEDAEGMTNYLRAVEGTEVSAYVRQRSDGSIKVSLRSAGHVDVSVISIMFGGGGHDRAAGYTMKDDYETGKSKLIKVVGEMIDDYTAN